MSKLRMQIEDNLDIYLSNTRVENLFINELLPSAPGDCVKVYLFGMMYAQHRQEMDIETMARALNMSVTEVGEAFNYWARKGAVRIESKTDGNDYNVIFISQVNALYGIPSEQTTNIASGPSGESNDRFSEMMNEEIRGLFQEYEEMSGKTVSKKAMDKIMDSIYTYGITPDVFSYAIKYAEEHEKYSIDYIARVALRWTEEGCSTIADVKELLDKNTQRTSFYGMIFRAVGFNRLPSPADRELMDKWFDSWDYSIGEVLDACKKTAGQREPSLKYVDRILENKYLEAGGIVLKRADGKVVSANEGTQPERAKVSQKVLSEYYAYLREAAEASLDARTDEVCRNVAEMREIFAQEYELGNEISMGLGGSDRESRRGMREKRAQLYEEKRRVLRENGYPEDYLDRKYKCPVCKDSGVTDEGRICACSKARAEEAYRWHKDR